MLCLNVWLNTIEKWKNGYLPTYLNLFYSQCHMIVLLFSSNVHTHIHKSVLFFCTWNLLISLGFPAVFRQFWLHFRKNFKKNLRGQTKGHTLNIRNKFYTRKIKSHEWLFAILENNNIQVRCCFPQIRLRSWWKVCYVVVALSTVSASLFTW